MKAGIIVAFLAANFRANDCDFFDVPLIHVRHELGEVDFFVLLPTIAGLDHLPEQESREDDDQPKDDCLNCRIHLLTPEQAAPCLTSAAEREPGTPDAY